MYVCIIHSFINKNFLSALQGYTSKSTSDAALNVVVHNLLISRAETALDIAQKIATKRSGQRGYVARQELITSENELATLKAQNPQTFITAVMINEIMTEVFSAYESLDVEADEARAKTILRGLGFSDEDLGKEGKQIGALSGGWRMRVMLGKALYINPDILLLDEPSTFISSILIEQQTKLPKSQPIILIYLRLSGYNLTLQTMQKARPLWLFLTTAIFSMPLQKKQSSFETRN